MKSKVTIVLFVLMMLMIVTGVFAQDREPVSVCHLNPNGEYVLLTISDPAVYIHLGHGDLVVRVDVDESCEPLIPVQCPTNPAEEAENGKGAQSSELENCTIPNGEPDLSGQVSSSLSGPCCIIWLQDAAPQTAARIRFAASY